MFDVFLILDFKHNNLNDSLTDDYKCLIFEMTLLQ